MSFKKKNQVLAGKSAQQTTSILDHEGVKPSIITSQPSISTGSEDFDGLLGHWGLPLSSVMMIQESGATDFASILLRSFGAQGIVHNRTGSEQGKTKLVVIGAGESWGRELPGIYKDKKTVKREKAEEQESAVTVGNLTDKSMKIAWRYTRPNATSVNTAALAASAQTKPNYSTTFDFTTRLLPAPSKTEVSYLGANLSNAISQLEHILQTEPRDTVVRIIIPGLLHPAIYDPQSIQDVVPFLHCLKNTCRKHPNAAALVSLSLELFPRQGALTRSIEHLVDGVIQLEPFKVPLLPDSNAKQDQGLIHIYKLPVTSEKGVMVKRLSEHAFRVGRRQFEIKEFGIPVDESETDAPTNPVTDF